VLAHASCDEVLLISLVLGKENVHWFAGSLALQVRSEMPCGIDQGDLVWFENFQCCRCVSALDRGQDQAGAVSLLLNVEFSAGRYGFFLGRVPVGLAFTIDVSHDSPELPLVRFVGFFDFELCRTRKRYQRIKSASFVSQEIFALIINAKTVLGSHQRSRSVTRHLGECLFAREKSGARCRV
jgi:hypothetical protein